MGKSKSKFSSKFSKSSRSKPKIPKSMTAVPCTPAGGVRRFFFKLELLGQHRVDQFRAVGHWHSNNKANETPKQHPRSIGPALLAITGPRQANVPVPSSSSSAPAHKYKHPHKCLHPALGNRFKIALQNHDPDHPDAIIISTLDLDAPPFCCHEDLLAMSRTQLLAVADKLNARLPSALGIDTDHAKPESWIRSEIEWVVGIRGEHEYEKDKTVKMEAPGAPKRMRQWSTTGSWSGGYSDILNEMERSPPASPSPSPLTRKNLRMSPRSPGLESLAEEDENGSESLVLISKVGRVAKTKRAGGRAVKKQRIGNANADTDMDVDDENIMTPMGTSPRRPRLRSFSATVHNVSPTPRRVLRSRSYNLRKKPSIETVFGGSVIARHPHDKSKSDIDVAKSPKMATPRKTRSLRPLSGYLPFMPPEDGRSSLRATSVSTGASSSLWGMESPMLTVGNKRKRKRSVEDGEEEEMTSGIRGMNMSKYVENMDAN